MIFRTIFVVMVFASSYAVAQTAENEDSIAQSCNLEYGPEPEGLRDGPMSHTRICSCAARSVRAAWSNERADAFEQRFADYARTVAAYNNTITVETIRARGADAIMKDYPRPGEELEADLGEYGEHLNLCVRLGRPPRSDELAEFREETARQNDQLAPQK